MAWCSCAPVETNPSKQASWKEGTAWLSSMAQPYSAAELQARGMQNLLLTSFYISAMQLYTHKDDAVTARGKKTARRG